MQPNLPTYREEIILKSVSGYMLPGQTHYILGASGAGKTTLLNALSGRIRSDNDRYRLTGECTLNDTLPLNAKNFARYGAYVMQDNILFEFFTVKESIEFAAKLKLSISKKELNVKV